jgi:GMP synthase-like glutamine amidotransferase
MRVLVVENFTGTGLGQVGAALTEAGAEIDQRKAHLGATIPTSAAEHDGLVLLGGGQNALADDVSPYFPALLDLIRDFERADKAVLGICLGSQLLARAFGGENRIGGASEFGWCKVELTREGAEDPLTASVPASFPIFQWHDDTFTLPPGAVHLATGSAVSNQAFRIGRATYGTQFHFEADQALVEDWNRDFAETIARNRPDWADRHAAEAARHGAAADAAGRALARAWVALV